MKFKEIGLAALGVAAASGAAYEAGKSQSERHNRTETSVPQRAEQAPHAETHVETSVNTDAGVSSRTNLAPIEVDHVADAAVEAARIRAQIRHAATHGEHSHHRNSASDPTLPDFNQDPANIFVR